MCKDISLSSESSLTVRPSCYLLSQSFDAACSVWILSAFSDLYCTEVLVTISYAVLQVLVDVHAKLEFV